MNTHTPKPHWVPAHPESTEPLDAKPEPQSGNGQKNSDIPADKQPASQNSQASQQSQRAQPASGANGTQGSGTQGSRI